MAVGHLTTQKNWSQLRKEIERELRLWGISKAEFPYKDDSERRGEVTIKLHLNSVVIPLSCSRFSDAWDGPERNLCALREIIRSLRLADQRGIILEMAQAAQALAALPAGLSTDDPNYILGVRPDLPDPAKKSVYRELIKIYYPDGRETGDRVKYDQIRQAAAKLGLVED